MDMQLTTAMTHELIVRITLIHPARDAAFRVRRGKVDLIPPTQTTDQHISFDLPVRVGGNRPDGSLNLLGPVRHVSMLLYSLGWGLGRLRRPKPHLGRCGGAFGPSTPPQIVK